jgi:hypothetical protein
MCAVKERVDVGGYSYGDEFNKCVAPVRLSVRVVTFEIIFRQGVPLC